MKTRIVLLILIATATLAHADIIGKITFEGNFTINHLYDFNHPDAQPLGIFSDQVVTDVSGLFAPFVQIGAILPGEVLWTAGSHLPLFTIGGFTLQNILGVGIFGTNFVQADMVLTGHGYVHDPMNLEQFFFEAPAPISGLDHDVTGPTTLTFDVVHFVPAVPDTGSTLMMLAGAVAVLIFARSQRSKCLTSTIV